MNRIELIVHGTLLLAALGLGYGAWKADAPEERRSFSIFEPSQGIERVDWKDEKTVATVAVEGSGDTASTWITHGRRKPIPKPAAPAEPPVSAPASDAAPAADAGVNTTADGGVENSPNADAGASDAGAKAEPDAPKKPPTSRPDSTPADPDEADKKVEYGEPQLQSFPGNETANQLVAALAPVKALRQFDDVDPETLDAMGLTEPKGTLIIHARGGKSLELEVGESAYGTRSTYVRKKGEATVYLLGDDIVSMVRSADSRLMERRLWTFDEPDAVAIEVESAGAPAVRLEQQARLSKGSSHWTRAGSEARVTEVEGFVEKLLDLRVQDYPAQGQEPKDADLEPIMAASFTVDGRPGLKLELARAGDPGKEKWYARTPTSRGWVTVRASIAADMAELLPKLPATE